MTNRIKELTERGYAVVPEVISSEGVDDIGESISGALAGGAGTRRLIEKPWCRDLALRLTRDPRLRDSLPDDPIAVQCILFVKSSEKNWLVPLHQDLSIPVAERVNSLHCSGWSEKEGRLFVQPPVSFLERMLAIRVHLDECDERNGALRTVPGSHRLGRLDPGAARRARDDLGEVYVSVPRGGAMLMRPLLLHASSKTALDSARRGTAFHIWTLESTGRAALAFPEAVTAEWRLRVDTGSSGGDRGGLTSIRPRSATCRH
jgi:hypothetical protein